MAYSPASSSSSGYLSQYSWDSYDDDDNVLEFEEVEEERRQLASVWDNMTPGPCRGFPCSLHLQEYKKRQSAFYAWVMCPGCQHSSISKLYDQEKEMTYWNNRLLCGSVCCPFYGLDNGGLYTCDSCYAYVFQTLQQHEILFG